MGEVRLGDVGNIEREEAWRGFSCIIDEHPQSPIKERDHN